MRQDILQATKAKAMRKRIDVRPTGELLRAQQQYYDTANNPPADSRDVKVGDGPLSHTTGGAKGHRRPAEGDAAPQ